jgi:hypothetical protein
VGNQRLTASAMARPCIILIYINIQQDANNIDIYGFRVIAKINSDYFPKQALTDQCSQWRKYSFPMKQGCYSDVLQAAKG